MSPLLLLKVSVLLSAALVTARLLGRQSATTRHRLWSLAFGAMLLLPALAASLPALHVPVPAGWEPAASTRVVSSTTTSTFTSPSSSAVAPMSKPAEVGQTSEPARESPRSFGTSSWPSVSSVLFAIWLIGAVGAVLMMVHSLWRVRRLVRTAEVVPDESWQQSAAVIGGQLGVRHQVRLLRNAHVATPMAGGLWRPAIFVPQSAATWSPEHRDLVLAHELAHLAGNDPLRHLMTRLALACYWFHPLAWVAAREAAIAREQACDETVLAMGARPSAYARLLLDLAESASANPHARLLGALPMVHRSHLERRLMAILNVDIRPNARRLVVGPAIGVALLTLSVAAATPFEGQIQATPTGVVQGTPSGVVQGTPTGVVHSAPTGVVHGTPTGVVQGTPTGVVTGTPFGAVQGTPSSVVRGAPFGAIQGMPIGAPMSVPFGVVGGTTIEQRRDLECWPDGGHRGNFHGQLSSTRIDGRNVVMEEIGWRNDDRIIQKVIDDLRLCMVAEDLGDRFENDRPSQWLNRSPRVVMEARRGNTVQRLELNGRTTTWEVNNSTRDFDSAAQTWRDRMLAVLDTTWEISTLYGERSSLQGQISSIQGERSSLQGQISSLQGQVSSMQGQISSIQGQASSLRGRISSIQGHVSSLQGAISSEQGAISSLTATRYGADAGDRSRIASRIADHRAEISRLEREIEDYNADRRIAAVERMIDAFDARRRITAIEDEIRNFDLVGKVQAVRRRIRDLDVEGKVADIERQIRSLDVDRRGRQLEDRLDTDLPRLRSAISAIR